MSECDVLAITDACLATETQEDQLALLTFTHQVWINFYVNRVPWWFSTNRHTIHSERCSDNIFPYKSTQAHAEICSTIFRKKMDDLFLYLGLYASDSED